VTTHDAPRPKEYTPLKNLATSAELAENGKPRMRTTSPLGAIVAAKAHDGHGHVSGYLTLTLLSVLTQLWSVLDCIHECRPELACFAMVISANASDRFHQQVCRR
jgi:hypothetical protein